MLNNKELNEIIFILNDGNDFSEIYYEKKYSNIINMENNKIVKIDTGTEEGIGFRIINGLKTTYGYTNNLLFSNLKRIAKELNKKSKYNSFSDKEKTKLIKAKSSSEIDYKNVEMKEKIKILNLAYEYCKSLTKENIKQNSLLFSDATKEITIFIRKLLNTLNISNFYRIIVQIFIIPTGYRNEKNHSC